MSSDEEVVCVRKKKVVVADSSDENDIVDKDVKLEDKDSDNLEPGCVSNDDKNCKKKQRRITTFDSSSDSDDDSNLFDNSKTRKRKSTKTLKKSKSEDNKNVSKDREFLKNNIESLGENEEPVNREIDKNENLSNFGSKTVSKNLWYNNTDVYDAEGSSEEEDGGREEWKAISDNEDNNLSDAKAILTDSSKRKQQQKHTKREERKSKTKAQEDIKTDIHRESQRLMRQVPVSIPYHRPKQRSLAEFLVRRKSTTKVTLQASSEQLITALREIEQREKEAELFYKSESSEDDSEIKKEENNSENNSADEGCNENTKVLQNAGHALETDSTIYRDSKKTNNVQVEDLSNTEKPNSGDCVAGNVCQESNVTTESETVNIEKQNLVDGQTEVSSSNPTKEFKNLDDELCNKNCAEEIIENKLDNVDTCKELSCESPQTNLVEKVEIQENRENIDLCFNTSPIQSDKQSQSNIDINTSSLSDISSRHSIGTSCSLINIEEFSLKLSESQSEYESIGNCSLQSSSHNINREINVDNPADNIIKVSSIVDKLNKSEDQGEKTEDKNHQRDETEAGSEEPTKLDLSCKEKCVENELYKKYNVELKTTTVSTPKIIGGHNEVIDLSEVIPKPEVNQLMKRFLTHLSYKKKPKKKMAVELSIVSAERDTAGHVSGISEESVQVLVGEEEEEEEDPSLARPGAKLARLRAQLQQQMERQRDQEWVKRQQEQRLYEDEDVFEGEKDVCDGNEEEIEKTGSDEDGDETEEEEEEEEDLEEEESENEEVTEKKRKSRSVFLDDEAEESDEEPYTKKSYTINNDSVHDGDDCNESTVDIDFNDKENNIDETEENNVQTPEKGDDKKGSHDISDFFIKRPAAMKKGLPRTRTASDMFSSQEVLKYSTDEEELPSFQKPRSLEDKEDVEEKLSETPSIISPAFQLTALENMDVANKYNWSAPSTPYKDFLSPKAITPVRGISNLVNKSPQVCTQDLENLCSGHFTSQPLQETEENAQDFELFLAEDSQLTRDQDQVTPVKPWSITGKTNCSSNKQMEAPLVDDDEPAAKVPTKKVKKLNFSDDEDDGDESQEAEVEADGSEEEGSDREAIGNGDVEYDSEENEVEVERVAAAGEFLDAEAELSEEEWSSEDEDERGLDALEMEEADREKIDQRRLKRQLDQIHIKEMQKEDKKQVKLLQEMLLEDGELHSESKRQRLFRWSNNTDFGEGDSKAMLDSDEEKADEDEDEENWRKSRHERELFLQEHNKKVERLETLELEESDSQLLRLGQKALRRLSSNSQEPRLTPPSLANPLASPDAKKPFVLPKRGSFLSRGQQTLSRLAQMISSSSDGPIQQSKNSRNFVFTLISPSKGEQEEAKPALVPNKRKLPHLPLPIAKKPCVQKPKTANKKSLFEALTRVHS